MTRQGYFSSMLIAGLVLTTLPASQAAEIDPLWGNATIYFLMTDRFANGDAFNDAAYGRVKDGDPLRSFEGGDLRGVIDKLEDGYFRDLGVTAIWTTPLIEQVRQPQQEHGRSYAYHGYWPKDWTTIDQSFGAEADFAEMVQKAHAQNIRVVVDVIINHVGPPVGGDDPAWPDSWVRSSPLCDYETFVTTTSCLVAAGLPDIRTDTETAVALPPFLLEKWRAEGRLERELAELDAFFARTGHPRAPQYYIIKWLTDWVREYGVDGFRADTAKHADPQVWAALGAEARLAYADWKARNPGALTEDRGFYMLGEVFNYGLNDFERALDRDYNYGDRRVDFFDYDFDALINMGFITHAREPMPDLFTLYASEFQGVFAGRGMLNYIDSHDDHAPLDPERTNAFENAIKLMLAPGAAQIYYGDELNRLLVYPGSTGDARLRTLMNWEVLDTPEGQANLEHWRRLGRFRAAHPAVGVGRHQELSRAPYVFTRSLEAAGQQPDHVVVAYSATTPFTRTPAGGIFAEGTEVRDAYAGDNCRVSGEDIVCATERKLALFEKAPPVP